MNSRFFSVSLVLAAMSVAAPQLDAQSLDDDHFSLSLGVFITDRDTEAEFNGSVDVDASKSNFEGVLDWRYSGGLVFLKFDF